MLLSWAALGLLAGAFIDLIVRVLSERRPDTAAALCATCESARLDCRFVPVLGSLPVARCTQCGRHVWLHRLLLQVATGAVFAAFAWRLPFGLPLVACSLYACILLLVFVFDMRHRLILDVVSLPSMLIAIGLAAFLFDPDPLSGISRALLGGLVAGGLFLALYLMALVLYRRGDGLGMGDVKLALLIGLMVAWPSAMAAVLIGVLLGGLFGLALMVKAGSGKATMPYGTVLAMGALAVMFLRPPA